MNRNKKAVKSAVYDAALQNFLKALGVDPNSAFALDVQPDRTIVRHVNWTTTDGGINSGDFWEDEVIKEGN